jgi:hypothetical protein
MKKYVNFSVIIAVCFITQFSLAQTGKPYLESDKSYSKGKIFIKQNLLPVNAKNLLLSGDSILKYNDPVTGSVKTLNVKTSEVNYVKVRVGTKAGQYALYGGLFCGLCAAYGAVEAERQYMEDYGESSGANWLPFIGGFTACGAVVGGLIGVFTPRYKNFYIKDRSSAFHFDVSPVFRSRDNVGIALLVSF